MGYDMKNVSDNMKSSNNSWHTETSVAMTPAAGVVPNLNSYSTFLGPLDLVSLSFSSFSSLLLNISLAFSWPFA